MQHSSKSADQSDQQILLNTLQGHSYQGLRVSANKSLEISGLGSAIFFDTIDVAMYAEKLVSAESYLLSRAIKTIEMYGVRPLDRDGYEPIYATARYFVSHHRFLIAASSEPLDPWNILVLYAELYEAHRDVEFKIWTPSANPESVSRAVSRQNRKAAAIRHSQGPKAKARIFVYECWQIWRDNPEQYKSKSAFALGMLLKEPEHLNSQAVVCKWIREWERGLRIPI